MIRIKCDICHTISVIYDTPDKSVHKVCQNCGSPIHRVFDFSITEDEGYPWYLVFYVFLFPIFGGIGYFASRYIYDHVLINIGFWNSILALSVFWMTVVNLFGNYIKRGSSILWNLIASILAVISTVFFGGLFEFCIWPVTSFLGIPAYFSIIFYVGILIIIVIISVINLIEMIK